MHHSTCSSTSNLVFMVLVHLLREISLVVPLIPTFIASSLMTCPNASLVVSSIGICKAHTVTGQMANSVALVAFRSTWTIMLSLSDLIFSGGGDTDGGSDDEGSAAANSVMHASADGDRGVWC
ncbi:hypothetical protein Tco_0178868 [Tanacetum coccineum]